MRNSAQSHPCTDAQERSHETPFSGGVGEFDLDHIVAHSFRDFHTKGFDYLCLRRSAAETVKVYFFDGDVAQSPEAVIPHDHRYDFITDCLAGVVINHDFHRSSPERASAAPYERFDYLTPLNGGNGFRWRDTVWLSRFLSTRHEAGSSYVLQADQIHTITVRPDTVIRLTQYADVVPVGVPTAAYRPCGLRDAPDLEGLYRPMDADHALHRLAQYRRLLERAGQKGSTHRGSALERAAGSVPGGQT